MAQTQPRKLPPMSALEFAIEQAFRRFFFGLRLILTWAVLCLPLLGAVYYLVLKDGLPETKDLQPVQIAALVVLGLAALLAVNSISVNWHRRILLDETPSGLRWLRLDGVVWCHLLALVVLLVIFCIIAGAAGAILSKLPSLLEPLVGPAGKPVAYLAGGIAVLVAIVTAYRLSPCLAAAAVDDRDFGFLQALRATRRNTWRILAFYFWISFVVAILGGIGQGAQFAAEKLINPWVTAAAVAVFAVIGLIILFVDLATPTSLYRFFGEERDFPDGT